MIITENFHIHLIVNILLLHYIHLSFSFSTVLGSCPLKTLFVCMWCVSFNFLESLSLRFVEIIEVNLSLLFVTLNYLADVKQYDQRFIW